MAAEPGLDGLIIVQQYKWRAQAPGEMILIIVFAGVRDDAPVSLRLRDGQRNRAHVVGRVERPGQAELQQGREGAAQ